MVGDLPPSSSVTGTRFSLAAFITARPTSVLPVKTDRVLLVVDDRGVVLARRFGSSSVRALWALDARVALTLTGPGGGTWWIDEAGGLAPPNGAVAAHVTAPALTFPPGATRSPGASAHHDRHERSSVT